MSRVGKKLIIIPENVEVKIDNQKVMVKGPKGELSKDFLSEIKIELKDGKIFVLPEFQTKKTKALWGTTNVLISNMIKGVVDGFEKKLEIIGIGFRASVENDELLLNVGFSHPVKLKAMPGIKFLVEKNIITVLGNDKELVGQAAAIIKRIKPPEPYKGKGIRYLGEIVKRKVGKKAVASK